MLLSGVDIPFPEAKISIHQPSLREISYIGEDAFFRGCELLNISKDFLTNEDKIALENKTNFEIFMSIMMGKDLRTKEHKINVIMVLSLIFPNYEFFFENKKIILKKEENEYYITEKNFERFEEILKEMFCLSSETGAQKYNPVDSAAKAIAKKLKEGNEKVAKMKNESNNKKISVYNRYVSILAVGKKKTLNEILDYTVYQLLDDFRRFELKEAHDIYIKGKLAGAEKLEEVENWMKDIHS